MGKISPKSKIRIVISQVVIPIARLTSKPDNLAKSIAIFVTSAAIRVSTRLFTTNMVIRNLSVLSLSQRSVFAFVFPFLISVSMRCLGSDMIAISLPAENAENHNNIIKVSIVHELIFFVFTTNNIKNSFSD